MLSCGDKHSNAIDDKGEDADQKSKPCCAGNSHICDCPDSLIVNDCQCCRTKWLTTSLTLQCYYCKKGFLRPIPANTTTDCGNDGNNSKFGCIKCGKCHPCLSLIVKSCEDKEEDFNFWHRDFQSDGAQTRNGDTLFQMESLHQQLAKLIYPDNIRMIGMAIRLAQVFAKVKHWKKSIKYSHLAVNSLLTYCCSMDVANDARLAKIFAELDALRQEHSKLPSSTFEDQEMFENYLQDLERLKLKFVHSGKHT